MNTKTDIADRTLQFGVRIIKLANTLPKSPAGYATANQIVRSGTSIGANIQEAQGGFSKRDFIYSMQISLKEARETNYWLKTIIASELLKEKLLLELLRESEEIIKILVTIVKNSKNK